MDLFFFQAFVYIFFQQCVENGYQRNEHQHTYNTKEAAAQRNRCQHPDGGKADGTAYHFGIDEISFDLLNDQEHDDKEQRLFRVYRQDQECTDTAADECPENGDEGREGDEYPYQQGEGEAEA